MTALLIGVDIGTTRLKAGVFTPEGAPVAISHRDCPPDHAGDGCVTIVPDRWRRAFEEALDDCLTRADPARVAAIAISSQAQTYALLDDCHRPIGPAVSWLDTTGDAEGVSAELAHADYYAHTGWPEPNPLLACAKLRRRFQADPDLRRRARLLLFADGCLAHALTGCGGASATLAAMSGLYSLVHNAWWPEAVRAAGVPEAILPPVRQMGEPFGRLRPAIAARFHLAEIPVVAGTNDQTASALGAGLAAPGEAAFGMGTAWILYQVISEAAPPSPARPLWGRYVNGLRWRLLIQNTSGAVVDWMRRAFGASCAWDVFFREALSAPPGCGGLRLDPDWTVLGRGGLLSGLSLSHERSHLFRAALEGVACGAREQLDAFGIAGPVKAAGGGSASDGWMQLVADLTGRPIMRLDRPHAGLWGTAILGGIGAGLFDDPLAAVRAADMPATRFTPCRDHAAVYENVYNDYRTRRALGTG